MTEYLPTQEEQDRAERVQKALIHELNLAAREGAKPIELLAALATAAADTVTSLAGPAAVGPWFEKHARLVRELQRGAG